ncbi:MAG: DMT family transporter [Bacillota bacterium]
MHPLFADLQLLLVALIWGLTFPVVKDALQGISPFTFLTIRFAIAGIFLAIFYYKKLSKLNKKNLLAGLFIGIALLSGYGFQTVGMQYTTASNAAFITGLSVVIVPFLNIPFNHKLPNKFTLLGAVSAALGLALLSLNETLSINYGDLLILVCAVSFAAHIVLVSKYAPSLDTELLTIVQLGAVAIFSGIMASAVETIPTGLTKEVGFALALCAIPATSWAFWIQNRVQKFTSPTRTAIIFSMEPVFGAIFAYLWLGEIITTKGLVGCGFVLAGMLMAELN